MAEQNVKVVQCVNGHHFNADKYEVCPLCGAGIKPVVTAEPENGKHKSSFFNPFEKRKEKDREAKVSSDNLTSGEVKELSPPSRLEERDVTTGILPEKSKLKPEPDPVPEPTPISDSDLESFDAEVNKVKSGKTMGIFVRHGKNDTNSNHASSDTGNGGANNKSTENTEAFEPPVGWLVCVKGMAFGKVFSIRSGQNTIGRDQSCAIPLLDDGYVSRGIHAKIKYEPIKRKFTLIAGDTSGLTYLNGEDIDVPCELKAYDKISLSTGVAEVNSYMFVPLCGEMFSWEDYIDKE